MVSLRQLSVRHRILYSAGSTDLPEEIGAASAGSYLSAVINDDGNGVQTVRTYLRKEGDSYKVVGIEPTW